MKRIFFSLLMLAPFFASSQTVLKNIASKVTDTTAYTVPSGYGALRYKNQGGYAKWQYTNNGTTWLDFGSGGGGSMVYPGAGIALSTGSAWGTSITDNSANWNTAYGWGDHSTALSGWLTGTLTGDAIVTQIDGTDEVHFDLGLYSSLINLKSGVGVESTIYISPTQAFMKSFAEVSLFNESSNQLLALYAGGMSLTLGSDATGDTYYRNSSGYFTRLPVGTNGQVLTLSGGLPSWAAAASSSSLSALTAATGTNTINNAANAQEWQWNTLGAGTGLLLSSSSTAAASNTQRLFRVNQTGANATSSQVTYAASINNTKTGTGALNIALELEASGGATNYSIYSRGGGINLANGSFIGWADGGADRGISVTSNVMTLSTYAATRFVNFNGSAYAERFRIEDAQIAATSGAEYYTDLTANFSPTSGTATMRGHVVSGTVNQTGGANGQITYYSTTPTLTAAVNVTGFDYNPTVTSVTGTHLSFRATSGKALFGGTTITADTHHDIRGGSGTDKILRLADGSNNELFTFKANKEYEVTQTNAKYQERQSTGTTSATTYGETIYTATDISDNQSVTIEVMWTGKDSGANTGAGGIFYTTWTKASGTLAKVADNQLVTNDNMTGSWTLSTADTSGDIVLTFTGSGVANTEISFVTRIIKTN